MFEILLFIISQSVSFAECGVHFVNDYMLSPLLNSLPADRSASYAGSCRREMPVPLPRQLSRPILFELNSRACHQCRRDRPTLIRVLAMLRARPTPGYRYICGAVATTVPPHTHMYLPSTCRAVDLPALERKLVQVSRRNSAHDAETEK